MATKVYRSTDYSIVQNRCILKSWTSRFQERPRINFRNFGTLVHPPPPSMASKVYRSTDYSIVQNRCILKSWSSRFQERPKINFGTFGTSVHPLHRRWPGDFSLALGFKNEKNPSSCFNGLNELWNVPYVTGARLAFLCEPECVSRVVAAERALHGVAYPCNWVRECWSLCAKKAFHMGTRHFVYRNRFRMFGTFVL